jgi:predicted RNA-binding protein YlqC (UPF0109 family)
MDNDKELEFYKLLLELARSLVDRPDQVEIVTIRREQGVTFQIRANPADAGKLIGNGGQTARAIRLIARANGRRSKRRFSVNIVDTKVGNPALFG